jgi:hypothetical protein
MLKLLEICLEEIEETNDERFIRCVALPGGQPGLALDRDGAVRWMPEEPAPYGLWVSADGQLVLLRGSGAGPIVVARGGRSLEAPPEKPVILLDGDLLRVGGRELRVYLHGETVASRPPERLSASALARAARATAAAVALSAAVGIGAAAVAAPSSAPIEVRDRPPAAVAMRSVYCDVASIAPSKKGPLVVIATCPKNTSLAVGTQGTLQDEKGAIKDGEVKVVKLDGTKLTAETTKLKKPVKAKKIHFYVHP